MAFCNHCSRTIDGPAFDEAGPCPGCASLGHEGAAWNCPACGRDPGPDAAEKKPKALPRTPKLNRLRKGMKGGNEPCNKKAEKRQPDAQVPARKKIAALTDSLRKINLREFEPCTVAELREFHAALMGLVHDSLIRK